MFSSKTDKKLIEKNILLAIKSKNKLKSSKLYGDGNSSTKIVKILKILN